MTIRTSVALRARQRRAEHRLAAAERVLRAMRAGNTLHLQFTRHGPSWTLTNGRRVPDDVAQLAIASSSVVGDGDGLFSGGTSQTWRWWSDVT